VKLSAQAKYALRAIFDMAYHDSGCPSKIERICQRESIPEKFLEQIMRKLKAGGLVESRRGPKGGFSLLKAPEEITVGEIVRILEGPCNHDCCYDNDDETLENCEVSSRGVTSATWRDLAARIDEVLESVTIADMCARAARFGIKSEGEKGFMYII